MLLSKVIRIRFLKRTWLFWFCLCIPPNVYIVWNQRQIVSSRLSTVRFQILKRISFLWLLIPIDFECADFFFFNPLCIIYKSYSMFKHVHFNVKHFRDLHGPLFKCVL